jgi:glycosyltransferase involved in cell wall biosynthesis
MTPRVSVVMAVYNGRAYLREQIESVLLQLQPADELIIVDDASTDGSAAIAQEFASSIVLLVGNEANLGVVRTFGRGLALARNPIVFLSDQDDVWLPGKREAFVEAFCRDPQVSVVLSDAEVIAGDGTLLAHSFMQWRHGRFRGGVWATLRKNHYLGCAMAVRRDLLKLALPIPQGVPMHDMWLGIMGAASGRVVYLPTPYLRHRRHDRNTSPSSSRPWYQMLWWRLGLAFAFLRRNMAIVTGLHGSAAPLGKG